MKMWACAYKYEEDVFYDFAQDDTAYGIESTQLLPTKEIAQQLIEDLLSDDYVPVEVEIHSYREKGVMSYSVGRVDRWAEDNEWKDED